MKTYYIYRIDLMDSYPLAHIYDAEKYKLIAVVDTYEEAFKIAGVGFLVENPNVRSWQEWFDTAEDGGYDFVIVEDNKKSIRRLSNYYKEREDILLKNYLYNNPLSSSIQ